MNRFKAFLFDLNGTMIDDMSFHIRAWDTLLNELGAGISTDRVKKECYGKNHELLERIFPGRFTEREKDQISTNKEKKYQQEFRPFMQLISGLHDFLKRAHKKKVKMAIGSAAIQFNINFVLDELHIRDFFSCFVSADDVQYSKPDPETYLKCARVLNIEPADCIVFEDTPKGVEAAANAGMQAIVITTMHQPHEFTSFTNVMCFIEDYTSKELRMLVP